MTYKVEYRTSKVDGMIRKWEYMPAHELVDVDGESVYGFYPKDPKDSQHLDVFKVWVCTEVIHPRDWQRRKKNRGHNNV